MDIMANRLLCIRCKLHFAPLSRSFQWNGETHYTILGVTPDATPREIKAAYIRLSKQLHPDLNQDTDEKISFTIHQKYVRVNQAYAVLGNKKNRAQYDLEVVQWQNPQQRKETINETGPRRHGHPMNFAQRAASMGFPPQDPDYYRKNNNYHRKVVLYCLGLIVVGAVIQTSGIMWMYRKHSYIHDANTRNGLMVMDQNPYVTQRNRSHNADSLVFNSDDK